MRSPSLQGDASNGRAAFLLDQGPIPACVATTDSHDKDASGGAASISRTKNMKAVLIACHECDLLQSGGPGSHGTGSLATAAGAGARALNVDRELRRVEACMEARGYSYAVQDHAAK
jgi:hypothetical protein